MVRHTLERQRYRARAAASRGDWPRRVCAPSPPADRLSDVIPLSDPILTRASTILRIRDRVCHD
eukprot:7232840-Prymnesium_polylepis.5